MRDVNCITASNLRDIIVSEENGPALAFALAKDVNNYARINALPPVKAALEMGKLLASIQQKSKVSGTEM